MDKSKVSPLGLKEKPMVNYQSSNKNGAISLQAVDACEAVRLVYYALAQLCDDLEQTQASNATGPNNNAESKEYQQNLKVVTWALYKFV